MNPNFYTGPHIEPAIAYETKQAAHTLGQPMNAPCPPSPTPTIHDAYLCTEDARQRLCSVVDHARYIANRLQGDVPGEDKACGPVHPSIAGAHMRQAYDLHELATALEVSLQRIGNGLGLTERP